MMDEPRTQPGRSPGGGGRARESLDELRRVIVGPEQDRIRRLEERPPLSAGAVGEVLPEALAQSDQQGEQLSIALEAPMTKAVREVARRETGYFANLLAPTIGVAVRKAVTDAIRAMLQRLNETFDRSLSLRSFQWRIEARRTGRPFAEVAMLRSLVYRVEHVYLIHSESGLLLEQATATDVPEPDPDQVAAMLSALESFVREAFQGDTEEAHLGSFEVGELVCWVERGRRVTLAAVVRGTAPREYGGVLRDAALRIELEHRADLRARPIDVTRFPSAKPILDQCLRMKLVPSRHRYAGVIAVAAGALAFVGLLAVLLVARARADRRFAGLVDALRTQPGIVVTSARRHGRRYAFAGLRDPLGAEPAAVLAARGLRGAELRFEPYYSLDPRLVERRLWRALGPAPDVRMAVDQGTLRLAGTAPRRWVEHARSLAPTFPGVQSVDERDLHPAEAVAALTAAARALESIDVRFATGSSELSPAQAARARRAAALAVKLPALGEDARMRSCITITGHADSSGEALFNQRLTEDRAHALGDPLLQHGVDSESMIAIGAGASAGSDRKAEARSATIQVALHPATEGAAACARGPAS
jgi:OOP family OmpA-OmpF porin